MGVEQWRRTFAVNVEGTFLTARTWLREVERWGREGGGGGRGGGGGERIRNVGLIVVGSESGREGERGNADYAAAKSAVQVGLVQSLKGDVARVWDGARWVFFLSSAFSLRHKCLCLRVLGELSGGAGRGG